MRDTVAAAGSDIKKVVTKVSDSIEKALSGFKDHDDNSGDGGEGAAGPKPGLSPRVRNSPGVKRSRGWHRCRAAPGKQVPTNNFRVIIDGLPMTRNAIATYASQNMKWNSRVGQCLPPSHHRTGHRHMPSKPSDSAIAR